jgi:hypothetical protein
MELCDPTILDGKRTGLERRGNQLLATYERDWVRTDLRGLVGGGRFRRGFVEEVTLEARAFVKHAQQLLDLAPIRKVCLRAAANQMKAIGLLPGLRQQLGRLTLTGLPGSAITTPHEPRRWDGVVLD